MVYVLEIKVFMALLTVKIDIAASNTCGWCNGTVGLVYRSKSIQGPWQRQIISGFSCGGQVEGVLPLVNPETNTTTYVWHSSTVRKYNPTGIWRPSSV